MLVTGSVIIGMREESGGKTVPATTTDDPLLGGESGEGNGDAYQDDDDDEVELHSVRNTDTGSESSEDLRR